MAYFQSSVQVGIKHTPKGMADAKKVWEKFLRGMRSNPNPTDEGWQGHSELVLENQF